MTPGRGLAAGASLAAAGLLVYRGLVSGAIAPDVRIGRSSRRLGPITATIAAPRGVVFDIVAAPYGPRPTRAMQEKVQVLDRGHDLVVAAHITRVGKRTTAVTVESVRFERPERVTFRLLRGPVPEVHETFELSESDGVTTLTYTGELTTDFWAPGRLWGALVARKWEATVAASLESVTAEAERVVRPKPKAEGPRRPRG